MAGLQVAGRNVMVDGLAAAVHYISLHDAAGAEIAGGSPAYARLGVTWTTAANGRATNVADLTFDVPVGTVAFHGGWSALNAGTNFFVLPVQGAVAQAPQAATFNTTGDLFTSFGHGLANAKQVVLSDVGGAGLPSEFNENTIYFVVTSTTDTFQLSLTSGGAPITTATSFECFVTKLVSESFNAQGQYRIPAGGLTLESNLI